MLLYHHLQCCTEVARHVLSSKCNGVFTVSGRLASRPAQLEHAKVAQCFFLVGLNPRPSQAGAYHKAIQSGRPRCCHDTYTLTYKHVTTCLTHRCWHHLLGLFVLGTQVATCFWVRAWLSGGGLAEPDSKMMLGISIARQPVLVNQLVTGWFVVKHFITYIKINTLRGVTAGSTEAMRRSLMILDELDSGVGARLGRVVGRLLRRMSVTQQRISTQQEFTTQQQLNPQQALKPQQQLSAQREHDPKPQRDTQHQLGAVSQILCVSHLPQVCITILCSWWKMDQHALIGEHAVDHSHQCTHTHIHACLVNVFSLNHNVLRMYAVRSTWTLAFSLTDTTVPTCYTWLH